MEHEIFLTGATGALGSLLMRQLLQKGFRLICLVRPRDGKPAIERISLTSPNLTVIAGDIEQPRCGITAEQLSGLAGRVGTVVHCAASINFADEHAASTVNIDGLRHVLGLVEELNIMDLHHVSTAYVAGSADTFRETDRYIGQRWRNAYERSKYIGEELVSAWACAQTDRRVTIYRPSILVGCEDGSSTTFDGYYGYFRAIHSIAEWMRKRQTGADGSVQLPLAITSSRRATLNLAPIDWVAQMIAELVALPRTASSTTYHLVHPRPPQVMDVIRWSLKSLNVRGATITTTAKARAKVITKQSPLIRKLQQQIDAVLDWFLPYTTGEAALPMEATRTALGANFREPAPIDHHLLGRMLAYAVAANWGR